MTLSETIDEILLTSQGEFLDDKLTNKQIRIKAREKLLSACQESFEKINRIEVIDETGRVYAKGSIYGTPVKVQLDFQDDDRTLKVFVENIKLSGDDTSSERQRGVV